MTIEMFIIKDILQVKFLGISLIGSEAINESLLIKNQIVNKLLENKEIRKIILDMTNLDYKWGDWPNVLGLEFKKRDYKISFVAIAETLKTLKCLLITSKMNDFLDTNIFDNFNTAIEEINKK